MRVEHRKWEDKTYGERKTHNKAKHLVNEEDDRLHKKESAMMLVGAWLYMDMELIEKRNSFARASN